MSAAGIDWDQLPDAVVEAFIERLHLVEMLLDPLLPAADKRAEQRHYQQQHGSASALSAATCTAIGNGDHAVCCSTARGPPQRGSTMRRCVPSCWN